MLVAAVGMINNGGLAEQILNDDDLDVILVGRAFQRDTGLAWHFAKDLDVEIAMAICISCPLNTINRLSPECISNGTRSQTLTTQPSPPKALKPPVNNIDHLIVSVNATQTVAALQEGGWGLHGGQ
ncbi:uncharacterized protein DSM5745_00813 [Aspergillus mulundensis]|uniref:NADH:flavin oxidoreductase/NADH oxidase N-terminal domain-containing protein n=1 Tax=Aspergillus mulundensis TaxID=1810919 RepID=A0A3D8T4W9_9EURO|nr:hypothetical protein DSM5745_00813 [Aspergillus mulundensis]RDW93491.1 hypothetical protein DSM5745_00813 [Aspergillus mulundensis]